MSLDVRMAQLCDVYNYVVDHVTEFVRVLYQ